MSEGKDLYLLILYLFGTYKKVRQAADISTTGILFYLQNQRCGSRDTYLLLKTG